MSDQDRELLIECYCLLTSAPFNTGALNNKRQELRKEIAQRVNFKYNPVCVIPDLVINES